MTYDVTYRVNVLGDITFRANIKDKVARTSKGPLLLTDKEGEGRKRQHSNLMYLFEGLITIQLNSKFWIDRDDDCSHDGIEAGPLDVVGSDTL